MKRIGMRNIKTAIAVLLCIIVIQVTQISDSPLQACIATIISMQGSVFESFKTGTNRLIGTAIGALIAFLFTLIAPESLILVVVGIIITIYICDILDYNESIVIACIIFIIIMFGATEETPLVFSIYRLLETLIGIVIALVVNYFISPPKHLKNFNELKEDIVRTIEKLVKAESIYRSELNLSNLQGQISSFKGMIDLYNKEILPHKRSDNKNQELKNMLDLFNIAYSNLLMLKFLYSNNTSEEKNTNKEDFYLCELDIGKAKNYHIKTIKDMIEKLKNISL